MSNGGTKGYKVKTMKRANVMEVIAKTVKLQQLLSKFEFFKYRGEKIWVTTDCSFFF